MFYCPHNIWNPPATKDKQMSSYEKPSRVSLEAATPYRKLIQGITGHLIREGKTCSFSERHVQCIWFDPALRPQQLVTRAGEQVTILDPGRWNLEAGPDFRNAVLVISPGLRRIQGDIEIHIHPAGWEQHGHADDPRYQKVIAHVTFYAGLATPAGLPHGTLELALEPALANNPSFRMENIDTAAYPFDMRQQHCACGQRLQAPDRMMNPETLLAAAGNYRFEQKTNTLLEDLRFARIPDLLYSSTMAALGYKYHTHNFSRLARIIPCDQLRQKSATEAYAILMGAAGLLPTELPRKAPPENQQFLRTLWDVWWQYRDENAEHPALTWEGPAGRPTNLPERRLAAAATLFARQDPWGEITRILAAPRPRRALQSLFTPDGPLSFWLDHATLEQPASTLREGLVGAGRLAAWVNNAILPLAAATGLPTSILLPLLMPEQGNSVIRQTAARLLGRDHNPALYRTSGLLQQGLIQIFQDFCQQGCHDCQLAEALQQGTFCRPT
jgi:hypothetical protein